MDSDAGSIEPVPHEVKAHAKSAFDERHPGQVAALVFDSLVDGPDSPSDYKLRFENTELSLEVRVTVTERGGAMSGHLESPQPLKAELRHEGGAQQVVEASDGSFVFDDVGRGLVRLVLETGGREPHVHTDWFRI